MASIEPNSLATNYSWNAEPGTPGLHCGRGEMADALDLGSSAARRGSSSLPARTTPIPPKQIRATWFPGARYAQNSEMDRLCGRYGCGSANCVLAKLNYGS